MTDEPPSRRVETSGGGLRANRASPSGAARRTTASPPANPISARGINIVPDDTSPDLLARSVTHELRQSLWLIVGYAELLARPDLSESVRAALLAELRAAAARLSGSLEKLDGPEQLETVAFGRVAEYRVLDLRP